MILVTANQMQQMDHNTITKFGIPGRVLMENAGRGALETLVAHFDPIQDKRVAILIGRGNNGGDGFVIGRYLMEMGVAVRFFLLGNADRVSGDARANMTLVQTLLAEHPESEFLEISDAAAFYRCRTKLLHHDLMVDAILGTGLNADVRGYYRDVIETVNRSGIPVFSVDIPSGLDSDTGRVCGVAIQAEATATFGFAKAGHVLYPGNLHTGDLEIIDIGIPGHIAMAQEPDLFLPEDEDVAALFSPRTFASHKGSFGHALILAGSPGKTGAAALCANAAARSGAGLVTLGLPEPLMPVVEPMVLAPMTAGLPATPGNALSITGHRKILSLVADKNALALGPGMGTAPETEELMAILVKDSPVPTVIDADGLNCLARDVSILKQATAPMILTPHPGEMARLTGTSTADIQADRLGIARDFSRDHGVILVLKGAQTLVCCPDGAVFICPTGNPGMASGGMGDVLTGMITGFLSQGLSPESAALAGAFIHGRCGDILAQATPVGFLAGDLIQTIPDALAEYLA